jgi:hypothetical protein
MSCRKNYAKSGDYSRRTFLGLMSLVIGGSLAGCSSLRILLNCYPDKYDHDFELQERFLRSFVCTVIPTAPADGPNLIRVYSDEFYPFKKYCGFFLSDLAETTRDLNGHEDFDRLDLAARTAVVERGLDKDGPAGRLYTGAVFMAQYSFFAGIYDDEGGCSLIDFPGANQGYRPNTMTGGEITSHLAPHQTVDGNPT